MLILVNRCHDQERMTDFMNTVEKNERIFISFPTLQSQRFQLRRPKMEDANQLYALARVEAVSRYLSWHVHRSVSESLAVIEKFRRDFEDGKAVVWAVESKATHNLVGLIEIRNISLLNKSVELGFWLGEEFWGQGYALEILRCVIAFCCASIGIVRIEGKHVTENEASGKTMLKAGMTCEGTLRKGQYFKNRQWDIMVYSILSEEVLRMPKEAF